MEAERVVVRAAAQRDTQDLAELRWQFRSARGPTREDHAAFLARCVGWMQDALAPNGRWRAWLAELDGAVVGNVWLQEVEKIPNPGSEAERHLYISNLYAQPPARGRGIGRVLLDAALRQCRQVRPDAVTLWPSERSRTLYERAGFRAPADMMELHMGLPPDRRGGGTE